MKIIKNLNSTLNERDIYNERRELEMKSHIQTMDNKMEILSLKHENIELTMDSLVSYLNECVNQNHKNKQERGKSSTAHYRKEVLEIFGQSSSHL